MWIVICTAAVLVKAVDKVYKCEVPTDTGFLGSLLFSPFPKSTNLDD